MSEKQEQLNARQIAFVNHYVGDCNFHATNAAVAAGYSKKTAYSIGSENLKKPEIQAAIQSRIMSADEVKIRLTEQARGSLGDLLDDEGKFNLKSAKANGKDKLLKELTVIYDKENKRRTYKYKIHDSQSALDKLAKIHGLYVEKSETELIIKETNVIKPKTDDGDETT